MKLAIISDIHSNLEALTKALDVIDTAGVDAIYCLGDVVGYGADAAACLEIVQDRCDGIVLGNHDLAVATGEGIAMLPRDGQAAAKHNQKQLTAEQRDYLANLPLRLVAHGCTFVHAAPLEPARWARIESFLIAKKQFDHFDTDVCFLGHTHMPAIMSNKLGVLRVRPGHRYLINVGSIGQPRDGNSRLSFGFFDTETYSYTLVRKPYDVDQTAAKIEAAGLPLRLANRLHVGQ